VDDTEGSNLFLGSEFTIVEPSGGVVEGVYVSSLDCECLRLMSETEIVLLILVVDVRHFSQLVRLLLREET